jgi:hypothetical protein
MGGDPLITEEIIMRVRMRMYQAVEINIPARTTIEISGSNINTIPKGTSFTVTWFGDNYSSCFGLCISSIYNDEFEMMVS